MSNVKKYQNKIRRDALRAAKIQEEKNKNKTKIVFRINGKYNAVYLTEEQLNKSKNAAKKQGLSITDYFKEKYKSEFQKKKDAENLTTEEIKTNILADLKKVKVSLKFLQKPITNNTPRQHKLKIRATIAMLVHKYKKVRIIADTIGLSYHKVYRIYNNL